MAFQVLTSDSIGTGARVTLANMGDLYIGRDITVARTDGTIHMDNTIIGTGSQHRVDIAGTVLGIKTVIQIGDDADDFGNTVNIAASGVVRGYEFSASAVRMSGRANELINAGDIWSMSSGVVMFSYGESTSKITNSGTIRGESGGIVRFNSTDVNGIISLVNSGTLSGGEYSYNGTGAVAKDLITNTGRMIGNIYLGRGDDIYDGTNGRLSGKAFGGEGDDEIRGGFENDTFDGEEGNDRLYGGTGDDTLNGGEGQDLLDGGVGHDTW